MTAQTQARGVDRHIISSDATFTLASGQVVWRGALIAIKLGTGQVVEATGASDELVIGTAMADVDASVATKRIAVRIERGEIHCLYLANGSSIAATDLGATCYVADDQTVSLTPSSAGASVAGRIWGVETVRGVLVELLQPIAQAGALLAERALPAHVSNDVILPTSGAISGSVFDIATTAAATTVTLPAVASEGTELTFVADGTKNGHTVQYRDATGPTNLTTALTASKRHTVKAIYLNGAWSALAYISP